jgi:hypothetical protein
VPFLKILHTTKQVNTSCELITKNNIMKNKTKRTFYIEEHPEIEQFLKEYGVEDLILGTDEEGEWICASELIYEYHKKQLELTAVGCQREQLKAFFNWYDKSMYEGCSDDLIISEYLDSL